MNCSSLQSTAKFTSLSFCVQAPGKKLKTGLSPGSLDAKYDASGSDSEQVIDYCDVKSVMLLSLTCFPLTVEYLCLLYYFLSSATTCFPLTVEYLCLLYYFLSSATTFRYFTSKCAAVTASCCPCKHSSCCLICLLTTLSAMLLCLPCLCTSDSTHMSMAARTQTVASGRGMSTVCWHPTRPATCRKNLLELATLVKLM